VSCAENTLATIGGFCKELIFLKGKVELLAWAIYHQRSISQSEANKATVCVCVVKYRYTCNEARMLC
jgi:hypothetical protein